MIRHMFSLLPIYVLTVGTVSCGNSSMKMDGDMTMKGTMDGTLSGSVRLDGPVQIQLSGPSVTYRGTYVSQALFDRIRVGETTGEWLKAVLDTPDAVTALSTGTELWRWSCQPVAEQASPLHVFSIGADADPAIRRSLAIVELRDGVVSDKWRE